MPEINCPPLDRLEAFQLGELPEDEAAVIACHLETCPLCEQAAQDLDSLTDPVLLALRQFPAAAGLGGLPEGVMRGLSTADTILAPNLLSTPPMPSAFPRPPTLDFVRNAGAECQTWPKIPGYEVLEEIGRGGMGVVYLARQVSLNRLVALKMILSGVHASNAELVRFHAEAKTIARLEHAHIVQIHEIGTHDGQPFLCLEYVSGGSLDQRLNGTPQPPLKAAELCETLAQAMHFAHAGGIVHRDLKPGNVLLGPDGQPKIADFGLARMQNQAVTLLPQGGVAGTPSYMAPEQAVGPSAALGPAVDVYALGAILYEILTGRPPFKAETPYDTLIQVSQQDPVPPRYLQPGVPRDLETVCLKCLRKDPAKRYASANQLAADLRAFLDGRPIVARPVSGLERTAKWVHRNPVVATLLATLGLAAGLILVLVLWQWRAAENRATTEAQAKEKEGQARQEIERVSASLWLDQGVRLCEQGEIRYGLLSLARALNLATRAGNTDLERVARIDLATWRYHLVRERARLVYPLPAEQTAFSPDGKIVAIACGHERCVRRWSADDGTELGKPLGHTWPIWVLAFSPDGKWLATGGGSDDESQGQASLWNASSGKSTGIVLAPNGHVRALSFSADSRRLLTVSAKGAILWDTATGKKLGSFGQAALETAGLSPDGQMVVTGGAEGSAQLWDTATGKVRHNLQGHKQTVLVTAFSPDGRRVLTAGKDWTARLWNTANGQVEAVLKHRGIVLAAAFSPDGQKVATGGTVQAGKEETGRYGESGGEARLWDAKSGKPLGPAMPHLGAVLSLAFSPSSQVLLTGARDSRARFFWVASGHLIGNPLIHEGVVAGVAFAPDGKTACTTSGMGGDKYRAARIWELPPDPPASQVMWHDSRAAYALAFSPDDHDRAILVGGLEPVARLYDGETGQALGPLLRHQKPINQVAFTADGQRLLTASDDRTVRLWERTTGRLLHTCEVGELIWGIALQPGGQTFVTVAESGAIAEWDARTGKPRGALPSATKRFRPGDSGQETLRAVLFRPDGSPILVTTLGQSVRLWDAKADQLLHSWSQVGEIRACLSPNGRTLLLAGAVGNDDQARFWDLATGRPHGPPLIHERLVTMAFSPDGNTVMTGGWDNTARLWDVATGKPLGTPLWHRGAVFSAAFTSDGRRLAAGCTNDTMALWQLPTPLEGSVEQIRLGIEALTGMELNAEGSLQELTATDLQERRRQLAAGREFMN
jgi:WD40 repeat protein